MTTTLFDLPPSRSYDLIGRASHAEVLSARSAEASNALSFMPTAYAPRRASAGRSGSATSSLSPEAIKHRVVHAVDSVIRSLFPEKYLGLCHAYAVVGSNIASIVLGREYRPVAGLAVIDSGVGCFIKLIDNNAFSRIEGGAYHCWIESVGTHAADAEKELVDITYQHNNDYAKQHRMIWRKQAPSYLWGRFGDLVVETELDALPTAIPEGKIWLRETAAGSDWMSRHVAGHADEYLKLTTIALKELKLADDLFIRSPTSTSPA